MSDDLLLSTDIVQSGFILGQTFEYKPVTYSVVEEDNPDTGGKVRLAMFEGCIVLGTVDEVEAVSRQVQASADAGASEEEGAGFVYGDPGEGDQPQHGVGITGHRYRWPAGVVPYEIDGGLPNQARVTNAINHWHQRTRIRLVRRTSANASRYPNYVRFRAATGCWSMVGMRGGRQDIGLAGGCGTGSTIHEIGHAVGLWHEQSREDRDQFIRINWQNITAGREHNFNQHINDGDDYGRYDFGSIMHYGGTAFSRNGQPTIVALRSGTTLGQRNGLSAGDVAAIRAMYPQLELSRSWLGVQFRGTVSGGQTKCWFTHSWPAFWNVTWNVVPISPARDAGPQIEWNVRITRQSDNAPGHGALQKYFICVKNLVNYNVNVEARYHVSGWIR